MILTEIVNPHVRVNGVVTVMESIELKLGTTTEDALRAGQEYDDALDSNAHAAVGYIDHACFFFDAGGQGDAPRLIVLYPWADAASLNDLLRSEEPLLEGWMERWASGKRFVRLLGELPVEV